MSNGIMRKITSVEKLRELSVNGFECFISLGGALRSSKHIWYDGDVFEVIHYIDNSEERLTAKELLESSIGEAMKAETLYYEDPFLTKSEKMKKNKEYLIENIIDRTMENPESYAKSFIRKMMREALAKKTQTELKSILKTA